MKYDLLDVTCLPVDIVISLDSAYPFDANGAYKALSHKWFLGGSGNLFTVFRRLGGTVLPIGPVGKDAYGEWIVTKLKELDIETKGLNRLEGYQTQAATCIVDKNKKHSFISMFPSVDFDDEQNIDDLIAECLSLYLTGYSLVYEGSRNYLLEKCLKLTDIFKESGREIYFDPGPRLKLIPEKYLKKFIACASVVCFNDEEAISYTGENEIEKAALALKRETSGLVIVKAGSRGCYVVSDTLSKWFKGFKIEVGDSIGAGDAFFASFIWARINNYNLDACITLANAAGAVTASKYGSGENVATVEEILSILNKNGYKINKLSELKEKDLWI